MDVMFADARAVRPYRCVSMRLRSFAVRPYFPCRDARLVRPALVVCTVRASGMAVARLVRPELMLFARPMRPELMRSVRSSCMDVVFADARAVRPYRYNVMVMDVSHCGNRECQA